MVLTTAPLPIQIYNQMALPKKGLRKITVDNHLYAWSATGNDFGIGLTVASLECTGQLLTCGFDYHSKLTGASICPDGIRMTHWNQQLIVTPYIVRQVILYALSNGWNPKAVAPQLVLGDLDDKIDLRLRD